MDIVFYALQYFFLKIIYLHTPILGGWNLDQMTLFVASFIFVDALYMSVLANNAWWFPISINRGDLDYYLTRPASSFFFLSFKEFAANSLLNFLLAISLLTYCLMTYVGSLNSLKTMLFILLLINGAFLYYMVCLIFLMSVF
jgi:ABC-2 type transport system permease protein